MSKKSKKYRGQRKHPKNECNCFHCTGFDKGLRQELKIKILTNLNLKDNENEHRKYE